MYNIKNLLGHLNTVREMLKLSNNDYEELNNASKNLDKEISYFNSNLSKYNESYKISVKEIFTEFF